MRHFHWPRWPRCLCPCLSRPNSRPLPLQSTSLDAIAFGHLRNQFAANSINGLVGLGARRGTRVGLFWCHFHRLPASSPVIDICDSRRAVRDISGRASRSRLATSPTSAPTRPRKIASVFGRPSRSRALALATTQQRQFCWRSGVGQKAKKESSVRLESQLQLASFTFERHRKRRHQPCLEVLLNFSSANRPKRTISHTE